MPVSATRRWILAALTAAALVVAGVSLRGAVRWYERPFAGILLDPDGVVSNLGLPSWEGVQQGLRYPDRLIEVEGFPVEVSPGHYRSDAWDSAIEDAVRAGRPSVRARFETRSGTRELELGLRPLDALSWWLYAGMPMFVASLYVGAALIAISASPRGKLARAFAKTVLFGALFLFSLFDYHTSRELVPFFLIAYALAPMGSFVLPLRLPDDVPLLARRPWLTGVADAAGSLLALGMLTLLATGRPTVALRDVCAVLFGVSLLFFGATFVGRFARAEGVRRRTLRALILAMVPPHLVIGLGFFLAMFGASWSTIWYAIPALALTPLSSVVAFVRYDLWGSRALLSRPVTRLVIAGVMLAFTVALCAACAPLAGVPIGGALKVAAPAAVLGAGLVVYALGAGDRKLFPARAEYKPTIEQLSEELTLVTDPDEVAGAVERTARRWLPCDKVAFRRVEVPPEEAGEDVEESADSSGERAILCRPLEPRGEDLALTVSFRGRPLGVIEVGQKRGGALFTSEDIDLLRTIGNLAAVAMAHALSYAELERRRREQVAALRDEREALIETLAAEITHEVRYPINFFRSIFKRSPGGHRLDAEEVEIGCEEVERLERLVMGLRRVTHRRLDRRTLRVEELVNKAEMLLRDQLGKRRLDVRLDGPLELRCDPDQVTQVLVNLISNGLDAAGDRGAVGVIWTATGAGTELVVWDTGPGITGDPARIFAPWYTTKPRGTGLGLAITHRLVRAHGWSICQDRRDGRTRFVVSIPAADVVEARELPPQASEEVA